MTEWLRAHPFVVLLLPLIAGILLCEYTGFPFDLPYAKPASFPDSIDTFAAVIEDGPVEKKRTYRYTARQIVRYRKQLGGYVSPEQIREIEELQHANLDSVLSHLWAETDSVQRLPVNTASVKRLQAHPYLSFEQAKVLYELRRTKIRLTGIEDLDVLVTSDSAAIFTQEDIKRLQPYLSFEQNSRH